MPSRFTQVDRNAGKKRVKNCNYYLVEYRDIPGIMWREDGDWHEPFEGRYPEDGMKVLAKVEECQAFAFENILDRDGLACQKEVTKSQVIATVQNVLKRHMSKDFALGLSEQIVRELGL